MSQTPKRRRSDRLLGRQVKLSFLVVIIVFFLVLVGFGKVVRDGQRTSQSIHSLVEQNSQRIDDIQNSRLESCRRTYEGIREVFQPFFPRKPKTKKERSTLHKFNITVNKLKASCLKQVQPPDVPNKKNQ